MKCINEIHAEAQRFYDLFIEEIYRFQICGIIDPKIIITNPFPCYQDVYPLYEIDKDQTEEYSRLMLEINRGRHKRLIIKAIQDQNSQQQKRTILERISLAYNIIFLQC